MMCVFDWTIRITDLLMILALIVGPIAAVFVSDKRQKRQFERGHKEWTFRTLMTTRSSPLAANHIDAINQTGLAFRDMPKVVEAWKLYRAHLDNQAKLSADWWIPEREKLLGELLFEMGVALGYAFTASEIKNATSYYPGYYGNADIENSETRKLWLEVLQQKRALPILNIIPSAPDEPEQEQQPPPAGVEPSKTI
jgi:hypothetical protein